MEREELRLFVRLSLMSGDTPYWGVIFGMLAVPVAVTTVRVAIGRDAVWGIVTWPVPGKAAFGVDEDMTTASFPALYS